MKKKQYPLLPLRGVVAYPLIGLTIDVGRPVSLKALLASKEHEIDLVVVTQRDPEAEPSVDGLHQVGTLVQIAKMSELGNDTVRVRVIGKERVRIENVEETDEGYQAVIEPIEKMDIKGAKQEALVRLIKEQFGQLVSRIKGIGTDERRRFETYERLDSLTDYITSKLPIDISKKQEFLEQQDPVERGLMLLDVMKHEYEVVELEREMRERTKKTIEQSQREYYLREQLKTIQQELGGESASVESDATKYREQLAMLDLPETTVANVEKEISRLAVVPATSPEHGVIRNYLEWFFSLPWNEATDDFLNVSAASEQLEKDHYGLEKVKERILEYLAVRQLTDSLRGPILCLSGPPGVGKTSLARSIATALERKFVRVSLGGVRDEAEIRGHRRTYIGAMPGRIIRGLKQAGTNNPVFLLDEIDKMSNDFRGDPSSAMLEVLDPEQNNSFSDHYIEEPFDLSNVLFIATANDVSNIPGPLLDRMELIQIGGYTEQEKTEIAVRHLLSKQLAEHGLKKSQLTVKADALEEVVRRYTREAGVRNLERVLGSLCRKAAKQIAMGEKKRVTVTKRNLDDFLGKPIYRYGQGELEDMIGAVTGLAYTAFGGDTLTIEVSLAPGKGKLQLTGKLGDVMQESAQTAYSFVRANATSLGIEPNFYETQDIHIHVPEGAVPKDGPSAGITLATALISALTKRPVRRDVGMTGEITLRGRVLPIGGLKEKSLAAHRAGLTTVLLPQDNTRDIDDIPESVRAGMEFIPVATMEQVLEHALKGE
ncbi:peptidase [Exiguobacterium sp. Leaf187]|uniref:Lon protease n=3 Tax=Exiguobacterium TaxID=33986 RepID=A0A0V8GJM3_9BACL|nr:MULTISPECIES: endopeptidase La [Exiguobacterium]AHA30363.1 peptidase [Exiguobacterium sp. MH3]AOT01328.1 endopeptidase La [Exiguobacterium sp. U13-1]KQS19594.1 peptidase [Exiguobacterium sp. Leaf187]KSU50394.1 peptidase [Exiguobacterium enclense]KTR26250.1 peptidase [Exiguobacterium indicum]